METGHDSQRQVPITDFALLCEQQDQIGSLHSVNKIQVGPSGQFSLKRKGRVNELCPCWDDSMKNLLFQTLQTVTETTEKGQFHFSTLLFCLVTTIPHDEDKKCPK